MTRWQKGELVALASMGTAYLSNSRLENRDVWRDRFSHYRQRVGLSDRKRQVVAVAVAIIWLATSAPGSAGILFEDDFEGHTTGQLAGQGCWISRGAAGTGDHVLVQACSHLDGQCANGLINTAVGTQNSAFCPLSFPAGKKIILTFDAYAKSGSPATHNSGISFSDTAAGGNASVTAGWFNSAHVDPSNPVVPNWHFAFSGVPQENFPMTYDKRVRLGVVFDPVGGEAYGIADFDGNGTFETETTHFALTLENFNQFEGVDIYQDFRGGPSLELAAEFDNLEVSSVPVVVFSDDFEDHSTGQLAGQGCWISRGVAGTGDHVLVQACSHLDGQCANGLINTAVGTQNSAFCPFDLLPGHEYILTFDAYAKSGSPATHNSGISFSDTAAGGNASVTAGWFNSANVDPSNPVVPNWHFAFSGVPQENFPMTYDKRVRLGVVFDPVGEEAYGIADFDGNGTFETETKHFELTLETFNKFEGIDIYQDFRGGPSLELAAEFDNLEVSSCPISVCGNGTVEQGEDCDDGNTSSGDCCSSTCQFEDATTECRPDTGECDVAEFCDGAGSCPADEFELPRTPCGDPSDTVCDDPDSCDAAGTCLANPEPGATECRLDAGECDVAEFCDGAGGCPADDFELPGTPCGDPPDTVCDDPDSCDAAGTCLANPEPGTTECRPDTGECDVAEFCDGSGSCPPDVLDPAECDDGMACTDDSCEPEQGCVSSQTLSNNGVTLTLLDVSSCGTLNVVSPAACPLAPAFEFMLCGSCYNVMTDVTFGGEVEVCIDYSALDCPSATQVFHFDNSVCPPDCPGAWVPLPTTSDSGTEICAVSPSLSEFALFVPSKTLPALQQRGWLILTAVSFILLYFAVRRSS